jgi:hypothetical protein
MKMTEDIVASTNTDRLVKVIDTNLGCGFSLLVLAILFATFCVGFKLNDIQKAIEKQAIPEAGHAAD